MTALLEVDDLTVAFRAGGGQTVKAVNKVSLRVERGEVLGIVGESGSGKTSIARAILRLIEATSGSIRFDGTSLNGLSPRAMLPIRRRMQAVFQDPTGSLNPTMTVAQIIGEALHIHGLGSRSDRADRVAALLARVELPASAAAKRPQALSGGQRQRVGIARALAVEPDLIIADEAVSALDLSVQAGVINLLADLRADLGLAMVFVAHDLGLVAHFCDRVMVLYLGRVMEAGRVDDVFARPRHPYTRALLDAAPSLDPARRARRVLLTGDPPSPIAPPSGCVFRTRCPHAIAPCADAVPALLGNDHVAACIRQDELQLQDEIS